MRTNILSSCIFLTLLLVFENNIYSQSTLSKPERKALIKEIKAYKRDPESFKKMKEDNKRTIEEQEAELENLKNQVALEWNKVDSLSSLNK